MPPWQFIGSQIATRDVFAVGRKLTALPPANMKPGDQLVAIVGFDTDYATATLSNANGSVKVRAITPGTGGAGTTVSMSNQGAFAGPGFLNTDTLGLVELYYDGTTGNGNPDTTYPQAAAIYDTSVNIQSVSSSGGAILTPTPTQQVLAGGGTGGDFTLTPNVDWDFIDTLLPGSGNIAGVRVHRRVVTANEPASYSFVTSDAREMTIVLLAYRGLDVAALVASASAQKTGTVISFAPNAGPLSTTRPTDLYLCGVYAMTATPAGAVITPTEGTKRAEASSGSGVLARKLTLFDIAPGRTGPVITTANASASLSFYTLGFSLLIPGLPLVGGRSVLDFPVPGAIGLPAEGI